MGKLRERKKGRFNKEHEMCLTRTKNQTSRITSIVKCILGLWSFFSRFNEYIQFGSRFALHIWPTWRWLNSMCIWCKLNSWTHSGVFFVLFSSFVLCFWFFFVWPSFYENLSPLRSYRGTMTHHTWYNCIWYDKKFYTTKVFFSKNIRWLRRILRELSP